jgi:hypothetical protein
VPQCVLLRETSLVEFCRKRTEIDRSMPAKIRVRATPGEGVDQLIPSGRMLTAEEFDASRKRLWDEIVMLHDVWDQYEELFAHSSERVRMLNACAGWFFNLTQRVLLRETILGISRVTDPAKTRAFDNLALEFLLRDPALSRQPEVEGDLRAAITKAGDYEGNGSCGAHTEASKQIHRASGPQNCDWNG